MFARTCLCNTRYNKYAFGRNSQGWEIFNDIVLLFFIRLDRVETKRTRKLIVFKNVKRFHRLIRFNVISVKRIVRVLNVY